MNSFSVTRKKTPFLKHREEEEANKKRAEDETACLSVEFVESFQGSDTPGSKAFVQGGTIHPNEWLKGSEDSVSLEGKERRDDAHDNPRKCHHSQNRSHSPQRKSAAQDRERDGDAGKDWGRHHGRDRSHKIDSQRGRENEKSGSRERDDYDRDRNKQRDRDQWRKGK